MPPAALDLVTPLERPVGRVTRYSLSIRNSFKQKTNVILFLYAILMQTLSTSNYIFIFLEKVRRLPN